MKQDWEIKRLDDLCQIELGKTPYRADKSFWDVEKKADNVWLSIADLLNTDGDVVSDSKEYITDKGAKVSKVVKKGTLLLSFKLTLGRLAFAGRDLFTNEAIAALTIKDEKVIDKFFLYQFLSLFDWNAATEGDVKIKGKTLNKNKLKEIKVHFPKSVTEQKYIVSILDECFAAIDQAKANAEQNLKNAKELFESYLQGVFDPSTRSGQGQGDGWVETTLKNEIELLTGFAFKSKYYTASDKDILLVRGDNIMQGYFRWEDAKRWSITEFEDYKKFQLCENDVVLAMDRPWVKAGLKCAMISKEDIPSLLVQRTASLRCRRNLNNSFLFYLVKSKSFTSHLLGVQTGIGVPHISGKQILQYPFYKPPIDEQQTIVHQLDALRTETKKMEAIYQKKIADLEELKKSVLQKAFAGELETVKAAAV